MYSKNQRTKLGQDKMTTSSLTSAQGISYSIKNNVCLKNNIIIKYNLLGRMPIGRKAGRSVKLKK